jgi:Family of unknown function (DUF6262)
MSVKRNTEAVTRLAAEKSENARQRTREALHVLQRQGKPINFATISKAAKVSKTFLYDPRHADLAEEIRRLRDQPLQQASTVQSPKRKSETAKDAQLVRLKERVQKLEQQVRALQLENEILYGKLAARECPS